MRMKTKRDIVGHLKRQVGIENINQRSSQEGLDNSGGVADIHGSDERFYCFSLARKAGQHWRVDGWRLLQGRNPEIGAEVRRPVGQSS